VRLLPEGVEARCLFVCQRWTWQDFQDAEAGRVEIYFPQLSLWKRSLYLGFAEGDGFEKAWTMLLDHMPVKEKWSEPLALWNGPFTKLTLMHEGVRRCRLFIERDFSWDDVDRAVVFQPGVTRRGFFRLKIVLQGHVYQWEKLRRLRGKNKSPADYDVVDFLAAHLPKERLILCRTQSPATTLEEVEERKKMAVKARVYGAIYGLGMAAMILFPGGKTLIQVAADWRLIQSYLSLVVLAVGLLFLAAILSVGIGIISWRESREVEEQLDNDAKSIAVGMRGKNHKEG
jgi:hypothetical protein